MFYDGPIPFLKVGDLTRNEEMYLDSFESTIKEAGPSNTEAMEHAFERLVKLNGTMDQKARKDAGLVRGVTTVSTTGLGISPVSY